MIEFIILMERFDEVRQQLSSSRTTKTAIHEKLLRCIISTMILLESDGEIIEGTGVTALASCIVCLLVLPTTCGTTGLGTGAVRKLFFTQGVGQIMRGLSHSSLPSQQSHIPKHETTV